MTEVRSYSHEARVADTTCRSEERSCTWTWCTFGRHQTPHGQLLLSSLPVHIAKRHPSSRRLGRGTGRCLAGAACSAMLALLRLLLLQRRTLGLGWRWRAYVWQRHWPSHLHMTAPQHTSLQCNASSAYGCPASTTLNKHHCQQ